MIEQFHVPSFEERQQIEERARALRAQAMNDGLRRLFGGIAALPSLIGRGLRGHAHS